MEKQIKREKIIRVLLTVLLVAVSALAGYLGFSLNQKSAEVRRLESALTFIMDYSKQKEEQLERTEGELNEARQEIGVLEQRADRLENDRDEALALAELYQMQKFYFLDVMDWLGNQFGYIDVERSVRAYSAVTNNNLPESCDFPDWTRYERWVKPRSTMYMASPVKMGWSPYTNWSIREDVAFGPDHSDEPNYVGGRGYEFRYPLVAGTFPLQELHTTLEAFEQPIYDGWAMEQFERAIDLDCGLIGYIQTSADIDETKTIFFNFDHFRINVKLKYYYNDYEGAVAILTQAANIVIQELMGGY